MSVGARAIPEAATIRPRRGASAAGEGIAMAVDIGRARRSLPTRRALLCGASLLAALAGCGGSSAKTSGSSASGIPTGRIERSIARSILAQHELRTLVSCPSTVPEQRGYTFVCTARLEVGAYPVSVTETDSHGAVRYASARPLVALDIGQVEQSITTSIARQRRLAATVTCPSQVLQEKGVQFTCTALVKGDSRHYPFVVTEIDEHGRVRYAAS